MKISIEQKETKKIEIEIENGYYKGKYGERILKVTDSEFTVVDGNCIGRWPVSCMSHYFDDLADAKKSTEKEFKEMVNKTIAFIKNEL